MTEAEGVAEQDSHEYDDTLCKHGIAAQQEAKGLNELQELFTAGFEWDEIVAYAEDSDPDLKTAIAMMTLSNTAYDLTVEVGGDRIGAGIREIIDRNKTSLIQPTTHKLAEKIYADLEDDAPSLGTLQMVVIGVATGVAINTRTLGMTGESELESSIVNQFTADLISRISIDNICTGALRHATDDHTEETPIVRAAMQAAHVFNESYPQFEPLDYRYILNKLTFLSMELTGAKHVADFINQFEAHNDFDARELGELSSETARQIGRIRRYGIKPMVFELGSEGAENRAVYREPREFMDDLNISKLRDINNLLASFVIPNKENEHPLELQPKRHVETLGNEMSRLSFEGYKGTYFVTRDGELHSGIVPLHGAMSLRTMFERAGKEHDYELLRAKILSQIFDATAPAVIVDRIQDEETLDGHDPVAKLDESHKPSDVVYNMLLRRVRFMKKPMRAIKQEFEKAKADEDKDISKHHRQTRLHSVTGHLRKIPSTAHPSEIAILNSKEAFGDEYELPDGYTFVKNHERGDETRGRVIGHEAVHRNVTVLV